LFDTEKTGLRVLFVSESEAMASSISTSATDQRDQMQDKAPPSPTAAGGGGDDVVYNVGESHGHGHGHEVHEEHGHHHHHAPSKVPRRG